MEKTAMLAKAIMCLAICLASTHASAQDSTAPKVNIAFDARADFTYGTTTGEGYSSGIHGRYLNLMVNGEILPGLTYDWRQRLNKFGECASDVFYATDWLYLNYQPIKNLSVQAGKQVVQMGGYEYDAAPINVFIASMFWDHFACYQFGASATYHSNNGKHALTLQACNSPFQKIGSSCWAYNLFWSGDMGPFHTLWSVNMMEYERGRFTNYISLGNKLDIGKFCIEADIMNRATSRQPFFFSDYTAIGKAEYSPAWWLIIMAKGGYEDYRPHPGAEEHLKKPFYGGGMEFFPFKKLGRNLRLHAIWSSTCQIDGSRVDQMNIGIKWRVNVFKK